MKSHCTARPRTLSILGLAAVTLGALTACGDSSKVNEAQEPVAASQDMVAFVGYMNQRSAEDGSEPVSAEILSPPQTSETSEPLALN